MELDILTMLADYGSIGILAAVLWYQNREQSRERRAVTTAFQQQLDRIREQSKEDQQELRDRYMTVIEKYDSERSLFFEERTALRSNLAAQIRDVEQSIAGLDGKVDGLQLSIESILTQLRELSTERRMEQVARSAAESKMRGTG